MVKRVFKLALVMFFFIIGRTTLGDNPSPVAKQNGHAGTPNAVSSERKPLTASEMESLLEKMETAIYVKLLQERLPSKSNTLTESGLVARTERLYRNLGFMRHTSDNILGMLDSIKTTFGDTQDDSKDGAQARLERYETLYSQREHEKAANLAADDFESRYGIPAKMKLEERVAKAEAILDGWSADARVKSRQHSIPEDRMKLLSRLLPEIAGQFGTLERNLPKFEAALGTTEYSKGLVEVRLGAVEKASELKYAKALVEKRAGLSLSARVIALETELVSLTRDDQK